MKRIIAAAILAVLCANFACAQQLKPQKHKLFDMKFIFLALVQVAATIADIESTKAALRPGAFEINPLYGAQPSRARLYGIGLTVTAGTILLGAGVRQIGRDNKARDAWAFMGAINTGLHAWATIHNIHTVGVDLGIVNSQPMLRSLTPSSSSPLR